MSSTIFKSLNRIKRMFKIPHIITTLLIAVLLVFAADGRICYAIHTANHDISSETQRECSADETTGRFSPAAQSTIARQSKPNPAGSFHHSRSSLLAKINTSTPDTTQQHLYRIAVLTTVLRI